MKECSLINYKINNIETLHNTCTFVFRSYCFDMLLKFQKISRFIFFERFELTR